MPVGRSEKNIQVLNVSEEKHADSDVKGLFFHYLNNVESKNIEKKRFCCLKLRLWSVCLWLMMKERHSQSCLHFPTLNKKATVE